MSQIHQLTALIEREADGYVSLRPELDIASQGDTVEEARRNLEEAVQLFFESASDKEIRDRNEDRSLRDAPRGRGWVGCGSFQDAKHAQFWRRTVFKPSVNVEVTS
jgi:predicted RNase H-like HicB family nuclease